MSTAILMRASCLLIFSFTPLRIRLGFRGRSPSASEALPSLRIFGCVELARATEKKKRLPFEMRRSALRALFHFSSSLKWIRGPATRFSVLMPKDV